MIQQLERRIDNVLYKAGFAVSRSQSRQFISHGLCTLNGKKIKTPSIQVKIGDVFSIKDSTQKSPVFDDIRKAKVKLPRWLKVDLAKLKGEVVEIPEQKDFEQNINVQPIIEFYSR